MVRKSGDSRFDRGWRLKPLLRWLWPRRTPVRRTVRSKLMSLVLQTTAIALVLAAVAMTAQDIVAYRRARAAQLATEASILALATGPALAFDDAAAAKRELATLRAHSAVLSAALYGTDGRLYAQFVRPGQLAPPAYLSSPADARQFTLDQVQLSQRIVRNGEWLGNIYLRARIDTFGRLATNLEIIAVVTPMCLLVALVLSTALQRAIVAPLDAMSGIAHHVIEAGDYSRRVQRITDDEIGLVVQAFNRMLDEVQARSLALERSNLALRSTEQALREADRRKDEFLATLAHELRNPLAPIRNAAELLEISVADDRQRQWAREIIARQVRRMGLLLDDLLDVSRITRARLELRKERITLASVIATAIETARPLIDAKAHTLHVDVPAEPIELDADPLRLSQAISNLLNNAAKYTDARGQIRLSAERSAGGLRITVADTGIGLHPEALPRLFEMFSQIASPLDRTEGGLGIGLALVKGLVALHGGTVEAASAGPGRGSTFTIHLPGVHTLRPRDARREEAAPVVTPSVDASEYKVLIADDNQDAADSLALVVRMWGYRVHVAHSGATALELARRERPDACILDIGMPELSGYELARQIRAERWGRPTLLLALTGWAQAEDVERARAAGFDAHLTKPVELTRLQALLQGFIRMRREQAQA